MRFIDYSTYAKVAGRYDVVVCGGGPAGFIAAIAAAIRNDQALGLNPADDGRVIRVPIPALTEERRKEIVKTASGKVEEAKISLRQARDDARKEIKNLELPDDAKKRAEKSVDDMIKDFNTQIDQLFSEKESEIMKI